MLIWGVIFACTFLARADAFSPADYEHRQMALASLTEAAGYADGHLAWNGDDLDYLSTSFHETEPDEKTCPRSFRLHRRMADAATKSRAVWTDYLRLRDALLSENSLCPPSAERKSAIQHEADPSRRLALKGFGLEDGELPPEDFDLEEKLENPQGELRNMSCQIAVVTAMQFRRRFTTIVSKHYGKADISLEELCDPKSREPQIFQGLLRYGEDYPEESTKTTSP